MKTESKEAAPRRGESPPAAMPTKLKLEEGLVLVDAESGAYFCSISGEPGKAKETYERAAALLDRFNRHAELVAAVRGLEGAVCYGDHGQIKDSAYICMAIKSEKWAALRRALSASEGGAK